MTNIQLIKKRENEISKLKNQAQLYCFDLPDNQFYMVRNDTTKRFYDEKFDGRHSAAEFCNENRLKLTGDIDENIFDFTINYEYDIFLSDGMEKNACLDYFNRLKNKESKDS